MNQHIALLSLSCLAAAACLADPDQDPHTDSAPAVADDSSRAAPGLAAPTGRGPSVGAPNVPAPPVRPSEPGEPSERCVVPPGYAEVAIADLLDSPDAYAGTLVQTVAPVDTVFSVPIPCYPKTCEQPPLFHMALVGPADEMALHGGTELFPANGTETARVWGALVLDGSQRPVLVVDGSCEGGEVTCALAGPDCPATMTCTLDDCQDNGGNCGINPAGHCAFTP